MPLTAGVDALVFQKMSILREMWFFHIIHGEFYEAYHMYQDKIQHVSCHSYLTVLTVFDGRMTYGCISYLSRALL